MHTPGPWIITHNHAWYKDIDVRTKSGKQIAFVGSLNEDDARLIASAPDLLEALKNIIAMAGRAIDAEGIEDPESEIPEYKNAIIAIAKAEGGAK